MKLGDRYKDIADRKGISEETVREVINGLHDSVVDSLSHGEVATIPRLCNITPFMSMDIVDCKAVNCIDTKIRIASSLKKELKQYTEFIEDTEDSYELPEDLITIQIESLT